MIEPALDNALSLAVVPGTDSYTVTVGSRRGRPDILDREGGRRDVTRTCTAGDSGGCKTGGTW